METLSPDVETIHQAVHRALARRRHRRGQRAVRHRRRLLDLRPPPHGRRPGRAARRPRTCRSPPSGSCGRRRSTGVVAHRPHRAGSRRSASGAARVPAAARRTRCPGSRGSTSRSPTPPSTRAGRTPRSPGPASTTPTPASARCSTPSSGRACSTAPPSSSSPTTAWRRRNPEVTRRLGAGPRRAGHPLPRRGLRLPLRRRVSRGTRFPQQFRGSGPPKLLWKSWVGPYWMPMARRTRSSGLIMWLWSSSPSSICTHSTSPVKRFTP